MNYKELGRNIRKYRRIADLTQEQLAEKCDCSASYIGQIENARSKPSVEALVSIANVLGVTVDQLLKKDYVHLESIYLQEIFSKLK